jgi:1-acyl-sn-glycerol-3-phosphate acyltransferase
MAKHELFTTRMGEFYMPRIGAFPVKRDGVDTAALRTALEALDRGYILVVFPEGTRSNDGRPLPVKPGIGLLAVKSGVPVLPAFVWGTDHPYRAMVRRSRFTVTYGRPILPREIRRIREKGGSRLVAETIMASILKTGRSAGFLDFEDANGSNIGKGETK